MNDEVTKEVEKLIEECELGCSVDEFKDKVDWNIISQHQKLSEDFVREFQDKVNWMWIFIYQDISDEYREEIRDKIKQNIK